MAALALLLAVGMSPESVKAQSTRAVRYTATTYAVADDPGDTIVVRRINSLGEVSAGFKRSGIPRTSSAFVLTSTQSLDVTSVATDYATANAINDSGEVVGGFNSETVLLPFRSVRREAFRPLPVLAGDTGGIAFSINIAGDAVGYSSGPNGVTATWWSRAGAVAALPTPPGTSSARAWSINDRGDIVGAAGDEVQRAVLWPLKGTPVVLPTLPGFVGSEARSINVRGAIVGFAAGTDAQPNLNRAVLWEPGGQAVQDLGSLVPGGRSRAYNINARGEVVGSSASADGERAFLWTAATGMLDLNSLVASSGLRLTEAVGINERGYIVALGHEAHEGAAGDHDDHEQPKQVVVLVPF